MIPVKKIYFQIYSILKSEITLEQQNIFQIISF